jgi:hypothetical protein
MTTQNTILRDAALRAAPQDDAASIKALFDYIYLDTCAETASQRPFCLAQQSV